MRFSVAMKQPRFTPGDTGYGGLGFQAFTGNPALFISDKAYVTAHPYPIAGKDPIKTREAQARSYYEGPNDYAYYADKVIFSSNGNVDPSDATPEAIMQAVNYPRPIGRGVVSPYTLNDWRVGYYIGPYDAEDFTHAKMTNPATGMLGTRYDLWTPDNRPTYNFRYEGGISAFRDMIATAAIVGGAFAAAALTVPAISATTPVIAAPSASTVVAGGTGIVTGGATSGVTGLAVTAGKTLAGMAVSKAVASVVATKPDAQSSASQQAAMAAQLQQAQGTGSDNTGLLIAGGLLLLKILL